MWQPLATSAVVDLVYMCLDGTNNTVPSRPVWAQLQVDAAVWAAQDLAPRALDVGAQNPPQQRLDHLRPMLRLGQAS